MTTTQATLTLARQIATASRHSLSSNLQTGEWIRTIHQLPGCDELLRRIVRDDVEGMGSAVADALWTLL